MHNIETFQLLTEYTDLVLKWNKSINLISKNTIDDIWTRHIKDSMQLMNYLNKTDYVIDIGSGAGFPAIVLSILGVHNITLVESDIRKTVFLLQAAKISSNNIIVKNLRVENFKSECDVITSRAFASLIDIFKYTQNIFVRNKYLLMKGKNYLNEIEAAKEKWNFDIKIYDSLSSMDGKILEIKNLWQK
jgi:16S rRNA (guanine527-N7)-methyltransferase